MEKVVDVSEVSGEANEEGNLGHFLELIVWSSDDAIIGKTLDGVIVSWNAGAQRTYGYLAEEVIGRPIAMLVPSELRDEIPELLQKIKCGEHVENYNTVRVRKDGGRVHVSLTISPIKDENGLIIGASTIARDVTESIKRKRSLGESEDKYHRLVENAPIGISIIAGGKVVLVNPKELELFGFEDATDMVGHSLSEFMPKNVMPRVFEMSRQAIESKTPSKPATIEVKRQDGSKVYVEFQVFASEYKGEDCLVVFHSDITERKRVEEQLRRTTERLRSESVKLRVLNEKLRVVGKLTRHDIRNKLAVVKGNVFLARKRIGDSQEVAKFLGEIESAVGLVDRILDFNRVYEQVGVEELVAIDVGRCVDEAVSLFSDLYGVKVINECRGLSVTADSLLREIFYNLIDNSLKYGEKKLATIRVYFVASENALKIVYEDDGVGIPEDEKDKIFREGYGKGTGYGLFLMKKICEGYGWKTQETGKLGEGARFTMTLTT